MTSNLIPLALNELLCGAQLSLKFDGDELISISWTSTFNFHSFSTSPHNARINAAGRIERSIQFPRMKVSLIPLALNELLCGVQLTLEQSQERIDSSISNILISTFNFHSFSTS